MRRILLLLVAATALGLVVRGLWRALASDETRIRWRLEEMAEGFDETRLAPCLRGISERWRDEGTSLDRALLGDVLRSLFFHEKDPESGRFPYRVDLEREQLRIETDAQGARVEAVLRFDRLAEGAWEPSWRVRVEARMEEHPDLGWQVVRSAHETLETDGGLVRAR